MFKTWQIDCLPLKKQQIIQVVLNNKKNIFSSGISSEQIYKFAVKLFSQQVKFSLLLE